MTFMAKDICVSIERSPASYLPRSELYGQAQPSSPLYRTWDGARAPLSI